MFGKEFKDKKFNDDEIVKYTRKFNSLCRKNNIASFWWDTNFLIDRKNMDCFQKIVDAIMQEAAAPVKNISRQNGSKYTSGEKAAAVKPEDGVKTTKGEGLVFETAADCVKNLGAGWNLGNTFDANKYHAVWNKENGEWTEELKLSGLETETCWFMPSVTKEMIHYVKSLGFGAVRVPVTWAGHLNSRNEIDEKWMNRVKTVVDWILGEGMYCIINVHHDGGALGWCRGCESAYKLFGGRLQKIYEQIGKTFGEYSEKLLFEGVNEVLDENSSWSTPTDECTFWVEKWNQLFVDTVRKSGGKNGERNLIVQAPAGKCSLAALSKFHLPEDSAVSHLIFEFHNYDPQCFCWPQNPNNPNKDETPFWSEEKFEPVLEKVFEDLMNKEAAGGYGVPVICGEYAAWPKVIE